jgi:CheY-like chemotaxis protein
MDPFVFSEYMAERLKVLIAEDDSHVASLYEMALSDRGHDVMLTRDGQECIETYVKAISERKDNQSLTPASPFNAVVLDYRMPKKNGLDVAKEILSINPKERIIFASAHVVDTLAQSISELGKVVELLQKPFDMDPFVDLLEDLSVTQALEELNVDVKSIKELKPTREQLKDLLEGLRKIQKTRVL